MATKPNITLADLSSGVEMGKINDGYFSNPSFAQVFVDVGVRPLTEHLGDPVRYAGFGGGEGFLTKIVADFLASTGRTVHTLVVDANEKFLTQAAARGLEVLCADISGVELADYDLITMRSVNHYNDIETQQRIVDTIYNALNAGGFLLSQNLSGPSERYCRLASSLSKLPSLGRVKGEADTPHMTSETEFNGLMMRSGFVDVRVAGYAPDIIVGPEYYWARFNVNLRETAAASGDKAVVAGFDVRHQHYLGEANALIDRFLGEADADEAARFTPTASDYVLPLSFPIHVGRKSE